jgi:alpha-beta hydrolase superfamily lysophospholipase
VASEPTSSQPGASNQSSGPPYTTTELTLPFVDPSRPTVSNGVEISDSRDLTTLVWVPNAPGRRPLVVFAPGYSVGPTPYEPLLESWATHGFIVAAIEFPLTDADVAGSNLDENDVANQPDDVWFVTEQLLAGSSPVAAHIDRNEIALTGHSDGGQTVLDATYNGSPPGDPPIRAVIAMSVEPPDSTSASANPPILITQGDQDDINPPSDGYAAYADVATPKFLTVLLGGDHLTPLEADSPWFTSIVAVTEAFLDDFAAGQGSDAAVLAAGNNSLLTTTEDG